MKSGALFLWQAALLAGGAAVLLATGWYAAQAYLGGEIAGLVSAYVFLSRARHVPELPRERILLVMTANFAARAALVLAGLWGFGVHGVGPAALYLAGYFSQQGVFWRWSLGLGEGRPGTTPRTAGKEEW